MNGPGLDKEPGPARASALDQIETHVQSRLGGQLRGFCLALQGDGLILRGHCHTYYAKQLAQHAVMEVSSLPILANEIEVS
jgi:hypothetical protein